MKKGDPKPQGRRTFREWGASVSFPEVAEKRRSGKMGKDMGGKITGKIRVATRGSHSIHRKREEKIFLRDIWVSAGKAAIKVTKKKRLHLLQGSISGRDRRKGKWDSTTKGRAKEKSNCGWPSQGKGLRPRRPRTLKSLYMKLEREKSKGTSGRLVGKTKGLPGGKWGRLKEAFFSSQESNERLPWGVLWLIGGDVKEGGRTKKALSQEFLGKCKNYIGSRRMFKKGAEKETQETSWDLWAGRTQKRLNRNDEWRRKVALRGVGTSSCEKKKKRSNRSPPAEGRTSREKTEQRDGVIQAAPKEKSSKASQGDGNGV